MVLPQVPPGVRRGAFFSGAGATNLCLLGLPPLDLFSGAPPQPPALREAISHVNPAFASRPPDAFFTGVPPQTPAPLKPFPTLLRKVTGRGGPLMRTASARFKRSNMQASRCPLQPFGSACPSTRSGCAVPCGPSPAIRRPRSESRVGLRDGFAQRRGLGREPQFG